VAGRKRTRSAPSALRANRGQYRDGVSRTYVTTPIYYVNAEPHLGHAYTTIIGDAVTRWSRLMGTPTKFLTGTDEHGLKIQQSAEAQGLSPQEFTDQIAPKFVEAWDKLNIANDDFIRTTEQRHKDAVRELLQRCYDAGDIELDTFAGKYCVACEEYYSDDELDEGDLCPTHRTKVEYFEEENYFFRLSRFQDRLLDWYAKHPNALQPEHRGNEALGLIRGGLRDFSISRTSLEWGIPLPWDDKHVTYVWFDALTNYLAAVGFGSGDDGDDYNDWWPATHLIGKDIVRQHCVYWPAMLMSAGVELPERWAIGGWLLVGGEKMSKTSGNVVNPLELIDDIGLDGFRYYVLADTAYGSDGDFTYEGLVGRYNSDLANNLGNLAARVATVVSKKCDGLGTAPSPDSALAEAAATAYTDTAAYWANIEPSKALDATWGLIRATNSHLEQNEPWKSEPGPDVDAVMGDALEALRIVAVLCCPAIPDTAQAVWERIGMPGQVSDQRLPDAAAWGQYPAGNTVTKGDPLFPRIKL
jgi:methionyl-tRNA synthetase